MHRLSCFRINFLLRKVWLNLSGNLSLLLSRNSNRNSRKLYQYIKKWDFWHRPVRFGLIVSLKQNIFSTTQLSSTLLIGSELVLKWLYPISENKGGLHLIVWQVYRKTSTTNGKLSSVTWISRYKLWVYSKTIDIISFLSSRQLNLIFYFCSCLNIVCFFFILLSTIVLKIKKKCLNIFRMCQLVSIIWRWGLLR